MCKYRLAGKGRSNLGDVLHQTAIIALTEQK